MPEAASLYLSRRISMEEPAVLVLGWSWHCRDLHVDGRKHSLTYCINGRSLNYELLEAMKSSRGAFKNVLKFFRCNKLRIKKIDFTL